MCLWLIIHREAPSRYHKRTAVTSFKERTGRRGALKVAAPLSLHALRGQLLARARQGADEVEGDAEFRQFNCGSS